MKIGVIGAGQLGRMLALAGYPLAQQFRFLDTQRGCARRTSRPDHHGRLRRSAQPRATRRRGRPGHLRIRERPGRGIAPGRRDSPRVAARRGLARLAGSPAREAAVHAAADPHPAVSCRRFAGRPAGGGEGTRPAVRAQDAPPRVRRQGPALPAQARRHRARLECAWERAADPRGLRRFRARSLARRRAQHHGRGARLPDRCQHAQGRHPARDARAAPPSRAAEGGRDPLEASPAAFRLRRGAHDRILRPQGQARGERDGAPRAQLRALDDRRRRHFPVREPRPRDPRPAARRDRRDGPLRDGQLHRHDARPRLDPGADWRALARLRQAAATRAQDRPLHGGGGQRGGAGPPRAQGPDARFQRR